MYINTNPLAQTTGLKTNQKQKTAERQKQDFSWVAGCSSLIIEWSLRQEGVDEKTPTPPACLIFHEEHLALELYLSTEKESKEKTCALKAIREWNGNTLEANYTGSFRLSSPKGPVKQGIISSYRKTKAQLNCSGHQREVFNLLKNNEERKLRHFISES